MMGTVRFNERTKMSDVQEMRDFLDLLINACEAGDINEQCEQPDWREIYVRARALRAASVVSTGWDMQHCFRVGG
jgi:hypothetical protein